MTQTLNIRPATPPLRAALENLQRRASLVSETYRAQLLAHPESIHLPAHQIAHGNVWVAEAEESIVGFHVLIARGRDEMELDGLFVEPARWRAGIGRALVGHAAELAGSRSARVLVVVAGRDAEPFYRKAGFAVSGTIATRFDTALEMRRPLA
ncbi:GNAT family N-acetyltransferase [Mesorhizobium sp. CAU 1741]|uniref:GNAT family N-acetyltransferase n=1 Tax=Mesorhizobium sp. CAU 1741 TaxID=3140366 RepID=UPI00325BA9E9